MFIQRIIVLIFLLILSVNSYAEEKKPKYIYENAEAIYAEKYLGVIEVGATSINLLELYIGKGYEIGNTIYYIDNINSRTLIVYINSNNIIEKIIYKAKAELPKGIKSFNEIKMSKKLNIKNLFTSTGSRLNYSYQRIIGAYGKPTNEIIYDNNERLVKYIKRGKPASNFVYIEYSFRLINNKTIEITMENSR